MKGKDIMADILIIEDEEPIRELIKMHLSLAGHSYVEAADGMQGLELIKRLIQT